MLKKSDGRKSPTNIYLIRSDRNKLNNSYNLHWFVQSSSFRMRVKITCIKYSSEYLTFNALVVKDKIQLQVPIYLNPCMSGKFNWIKLNYSWCDLWGSDNIVLFLLLLNKTNHRSGYWHCTIEKKCDTYKIRMNSWRKKKLIHHTSCDKLTARIDCVEKLFTMWLIFIIHNWISTPFIFNRK